MTRTMGLQPLPFAPEAFPRVRIVGLGGSLRTPSSSLRALELALEGAAAAGAEVELVDIGALRLPLYDPAEEDIPAEADRLAALVKEADGMIWSSPLYHGTISGAFKNSLDWLQLLGGRDVPYLTDIPVGLIATAAGTRSIQGINTMAMIVQALRGWAVPLSVSINEVHRALAEDADGSASTAAQLDRLGRLVAGAAQRFAQPTGV